MLEMDPGTTTIVVGESGQEYENTHTDGPINQGGGTDKLNAPIDTQK
jgi:hypothetical protein